MTTTISFATRDCVVIGCDSLATTTTQMVDPQGLWSNFFNEDGSLQTDEDGEVKLRSFKDVADHIEKVPYNQLPSVTKIFDLRPAKIGLLFAGLAVIGDKSVKNIVDEFKADDDIQDYFKKSSYTVSGTAKRLLERIRSHYDPVFENRLAKPTIEILVSGYSQKHTRPEVYRIRIGDGNNESEELRPSIERGDYSVVFGGQYDVIQRVVNGLDIGNYVRFRHRVGDITDQYREIILEQLARQGMNADIPRALDLEEQDKLNLYDLTWVQGVTTDLPNFSEQAAIDFVDFLVDMMCRAQQFSNRIPTVGGGIHIALITKAGGFRWISKEEYTYKGRGVPKHD